MINNKDSSFLREVEGRLDNLSAVENEKKDEGTEQSKVISEIEKRFSAIFGDDNKEVKSEARTKEEPTVEEIIFNTELADSKSIDQLPAETLMIKVLPSDSKSENKIPDDKVSTEKWKTIPYTLDKTFTKYEQSNINQNWMETAKSLDENQLLDKSEKKDRQTSSFNSHSGNKLFRQPHAVGSNEKIRKFAPENAASHKITWISLSIVFLILCFMAVGFLWFYPEKKNQAQQWMVANIPYADKVLTVGSEQKNKATGKIKFIDVQQRFIRNTSLGRDIRVIEGIVKNNTAANVSKVKLFGELYDSKGLLLLTSKTSLAGNVLTDDKLEKLDEDEIFSALSIAPASNLSDARIPPLGQVPFMIVFSQEPAGVFKLVVIPVSE
jgi:cbb3-type cytochrome oxidase subunit 3